MTQLISSQSLPRDRLWAGRLHLGTIAAAVFFAGVYIAIMVAVWRAAAQVDPQTLTSFFP